MKGVIKFKIRIFARFLCKLIIDLLDLTMKLIYFCNIKICLLSQESIN